MSLKLDVNQNESLTISEVKDLEVDDISVIESRTMLSDPLMPNRPNYHKICYRKHYIDGENRSENLD